MQELPTTLKFALMDGNEYNSSIPDFFANSSIQFLYFANASLVGNFDLLKQDGAFPELFEFWVDENPSLTGTLPTEIGVLTNLASLSLLSNALTGPIPSELGQLSNSMIQMFLYDNAFTGMIPSELGNLSLMSTLQLEGNDLTGTMPDEICSNVGFLRPLTTLGVDADEVSFDCCTCVDLEDCNPGFSF